MSLRYVLRPDVVLHLGSGQQGLHDFALRLLSTGVSPNHRTWEEAGRWLLLLPEDGTSFVEVWASR